MEDGSAVAGPSVNLGEGDADLEMKETQKKHITMTEADGEGEK